MPTPPRSADIARFKVTGAVAAGYAKNKTVATLCFSLRACKWKKKKKKKKKTEVQRIPGVQGVGGVLQPPNEAIGITVKRTPLGAVLKGRGESSGRFCQLRPPAELQRDSFLIGVLNEGKQRLSTAKG